MACNALKQTRLVYAFITPHPIAAVDARDVHSPLNFTTHTQMRKKRALHTRCARFMTRSTIFGYAMWNDACALLARRQQLKCVKMRYRP